MSWIKKRVYPSFSSQTFLLDFGYKIINQTFNVKEMILIGIRIVDPGVEMITPKHLPNWKTGFMSLIEECGRVSHKSERLIAEESAEPFIRKIANKLGHESILEHGVFTARFIMSRAASHQLVRHRISSYTQSSQRYCDYGKVDVKIDEGDGKFLRVICPPSIGVLVDGDTYVREGDHICQVLNGKKISGTDSIAVTPDDQESETCFKDCVAPAGSHVLARWLHETIGAYEAYLYFRDEKIKGEDARYSLPNACKTEVYTTFNFRTWRHVLRQRGLNKHAQWEIRQIFQQAYAWFMQEAPALFDPHTIGHINQSLHGLPILVDEGHRLRPASFRLAEVARDIAEKDGRFVAGDDSTAVKALVIK